MRKKMPRKYPVVDQFWCKVVKNGECSIRNGQLGRANALKYQCNFMLFMNLITTFVPMHNDVENF